MNKVAGWVWFPFRVTIRFIARNGKRIAVTIAGFVLLLAGLLMMVLPGPGLLFIILGFAVLATEYVWAERALNIARSKAEQAKDKVFRRKNGSNAAATPPAESTPEPPG
jgi:uncharacterized protein (TIGR02611 family)